MEVKELYEMLGNLISEGKGNYRVCIECLDGFAEWSNTVHIDDRHEEIAIVGA